MITLPGPIIVEKNKIEGSGPWLDLVELYVSPSQITYLNNGNDLVAYDNGTGSHDYYPFPFRVDQTVQDGDNNISASSITVANINGTMSRLVKASQGTFIDRTVILRRGYVGGDVAYSMIFKISKISYDRDAVTFELGYEDVNRLFFPKPVVMRNRCRFQYGDVLCQATAAVLGSKPHCAHTIQDCIVVGQVEASLALTANHPKFFGGAFGLVKQ